MKKLFQDIDILGIILGLGGLCSIITGIWIASMHLSLKLIFTGVIAITMWLTSE